MQQAIPQHRRASNADVETTVCSDADRATPPLVPVSPPSHATWRPRCPSSATPHPPSALRPSQSSWSLRFLSGFRNLLRADAFRCSCRCRLGVLRVYELRRSFKKGFSESRLAAVAGVDVKTCAGHELRRHGCCDAPTGACAAGCAHRRLRPEPADGRATAPVSDGCKACR